MGKFFVPPESIKGDTALIKGKEAHHILDVMRLQKGDEIEAFDGSGRSYRGEILDTRAKRVKLKIKSVQQQPERVNLDIALIQALPKKKKLDYIIEKCTELGIDSIIPTQTARTIVRWDKPKEHLRHLRWQKIACEAAKQCGRATVPKVEDITPWADILSILNNFDLKLLACLSAKAKPIKDVLRSKNGAKSVALLIGPEGDFTPREIEQACAAGCIAISLGTNVLKSDTAAISTLAVLNYEFR